MNPQRGTLFHPAVYLWTSALTVRGEVAEGEGGLALDFEGRRVHQGDQVGDQARFRLRACPSQVSVDLEKHTNPERKPTVCNLRRFSASTAMLDKAVVQ